jgi:hypothetical protein
VGLADKRRGKGENKREKGKKEKKWKQGVTAWV